VPTRKRDWLIRWWVRMVVCAKEIKRHVNTHGCYGYKYVQACVETHLHSFSVEMGHIRLAHFCLGGGGGGGMLGMGVGANKHICKNF
jgi:hypothetical protein